MRNKTSTWIFFFLFVLTASGVFAAFSENSRHSQNPFKKDFKRVIKQGKKLKELAAILSMLIEGKPVPEKYLDHPLIAEYNGYRELHIKPDWLLVYKIEGDTLTLARTGSHSELFG